MKTLSTVWGCFAYIKRCMNKELVEVSICCHQQHTVVGQSRINYGIASRRLSLLMNYLFSMSRPQRYSPAAVLLGFGKRIEKASLSNSSKSVRQRFLSYKLGDGKKTCSSFCLSKENQTIPNYITFGRIFASPCLTYAVMNDMKVWALGGCLVFAFSDWLDGYIAKNYDQKSTLGAYLDPLADKVMIGSLSIGLMHHNLIPVELVGLIVGRDVFLLTMSFIIRGLDKAPDAPFFETTKTSTFEVIPSDISKVNTGIQFILLSSTLSNFAFGLPGIGYIEPLWWITATTTIMSGLGYLDGSAIKFKNRKLW